MSDSQISEEELELSDAPSSQTDALQTLNHATDTYEQVIRKWKTARDVNTWIARNFAYDLDRALQLADDSESRETTVIYTPTQTYDFRKGVCVDLSRFAVETIRAIDPSIDVKYLAIDFEPLRIGDRVLIRHWLVVYREDDQWYTMADSKYPGRMGGPYRDITEFISEYQKIRKRKIESCQLLDTYKKALKRQKRLRREKRSKQELRS